MILILRKIRERLLRQNKFSKYLIYALGEILLVVIGILIALTINNNNDARKDRNKELNYLKNISVDLRINIDEMNRFLEVRKRLIKSAENILEHFEGKAITDYNEFNAMGVGIYDWKKFYQNNNTFQELVNSGNLALISNDTIKNMLLNIELLYTKMKSEEDHFRFDTEELIYQPLYATMDLTKLVNNFAYHMSDGNEGRNIELSKVTFEPYLKNPLLKNGFMMAILELGVINGQMAEMKAMTDSLIQVIGREMKR